MNYRVGLGRVNPTPTVDKKQKKSVIFHLAAIYNPPCHRYLVAFFFKKPLRNSAVTPPWPPFNNIEHYHLQLLEPV